MKKKNTVVIETVTKREKTVVSEDAKSTLLRSRNHSFGGDVTINTHLKKMFIMPQDDGAEDLPNFKWHGRLARTEQSNILFVCENNRHSSEAVTLMKMPHGAGRVLKNGSIRLTLTINPDEETLNELSALLVSETVGFMDYLCMHSESVLHIVKKQRQNVFLSKYE